MQRLSRILLVALLAVLVAAFLLYRGGYLKFPQSASPITGSKGSAPEVVGIKGWLNSKPLKISGLRGKVVMVDFWTYTCINCQRTFPYLRSWHEKYAGKGLVIIGVHSPEFDFEKISANVARAVKRYRVTWPVALDSDMKTWAAYGNQYWPHKYLIDKSGNIRYDHVGEGGYRETEREIQRLLSEGGPPVTDKLTTERPVPMSPLQTPELYAGLGRGELGNAGGARPGVAHDYADPGEYARDTLYAVGRWTVSRESLAHARKTTGLRDYLVLRYSAKDVYVVTTGTAKTGAAKSARPKSSYLFYVTLDGHPLAPGERGKDVRVDSRGRSYVQVDLATLYHVVSTKGFATHTLRLSSDSDEFAVFAFTFGS